MKDLITQKQENFIKIICKELDIQFEGTTKKEATLFINKYHKIFQVQTKLNGVLNEIRINE